MEHPYGMTIASRIYFGVGMLFALGVLTLAGTSAMKIWDWIPASRALPQAEARAKAVGLPLVARDLAPSGPVPPSENAAPSIRAMSDEYQRLRSAKDFEDAIRDGNWSSAARELPKFDRMIRFAYQAADKPGIDFDRDWDLGPNVLFPEFANMKGAVKVLTYRARIRARQGDAAGALEDLRVARKIADFTAKEPTIIGLLVQIAGRRIVSRTIELVAADWHDKPANLQKLAALTREPALPYDYANAMKGEVFMGVATLRNFDAFGGMKMLAAFSGTGGESLPKVDPRSLQREGMPTGMKARAYMTRHLEYWTDLWPAIQACGDDPRAVGKLMDAKSQAIEQRREASFVLGKIMFPVFAQSGEAVVRANATDAAASAFVNGMLVHAQTGRWPLRVDVLDPFTAKPLRVKAYGDTFRVYSVGQDGKDDGGIARVELTSKTDDLPYDEVAAYPPVTAPLGR